MATIRTGSIGPSAVLLLVSVVLFVLAAFDVKVDQFDSLNIAETGLAFFAASFLV